MAVVPYAEGAAADATTPTEAHPDATSSIDASVAAPIPAVPLPFDESQVAAIRATPAPDAGGPPDLLAAPDPEAFFDEAEQAREAGQAREALALYVLASDAYARAGAREAALEVCQRALAISPDAPSVHLALVRLYLGRGWRERAVEKLTLLDRLLALGPASGARRRSPRSPRPTPTAIRGCWPSPPRSRSRSRRPPPPPRSHRRSMGR